MDLNKKSLKQNESSKKESKSLSTNEFQLKLSPTPSCSKFTNVTEDVKENRFYKCKVDVHEPRTETFPEESDIIMGLKDIDNVFATYSNHQMYDENNNCILTDLNELGMRFHNIHSENVKYNRNGDRLLDDTTLSLNDDKINNIASVLKKCLSPKININDNSVYINNNSSIIPNNDNIQLSIPNTENKIEVSERENEEEYKMKFNIGLDFEKFIKLNRIMKDNNKNILQVYNDNKESATNNVKNISLSSINSDNSIGTNNCMIQEITLSLNDNNNKENIKDPIKSFEKDQILDSDTCSGYCSSDFEFIDEAESKKGGLTTKSNLNSKVVKKERKINVAEENDSIIYDYFNIPEQSSPISNSVPNGNDYNDMFLNVPYLSQNLEKKAIRSVSAKHAGYAGVGFDIQYFKIDSKFDNEYKEEVDETVKIILSMYPQENAARRPRRRI